VSEPPIGDTMKQRYSMVYLLYVSSSTVCIYTVPVVGQLICRVRDLPPPPPPYLFVSILGRFLVHFRSFFVHFRSFKVHFRAFSGIFGLLGPFTSIFQLICIKLPMGAVDYMTLGLVVFWVAVSIPRGI